MLLNFILIFLKTVQSESWNVLVRQNKKKCNEEIKTIFKGM